MSASPPGPLAVWLAAWRRGRRRWKRVAIAERRFFEAVLELGPSDVAIDCGANAGFYTRHLARSGAQVHAFEPDPVAFEALQAATRGLPNVTLHQAAVTLSDGHAALRRAEHFASAPLRRTVASTLIEGDHDGRREALTVRTVDFPAFLRSLPTPPRLVKMDIEGAEVAILEALFASGEIDRLGEVFVETHERQHHALRARTFALIDAAQARGARVDFDWG